jgi:hypothetical protein
MYIRYNDVLRGVQGNRETQSEDTKLSSAPDSKVGSVREGI